MRGNSIVGPEADAADALIVGQLLVGALHDGVGVGAGIKNQDGVDAVGSDHCGIAHALLTLKHFFDVFGKDVQAFRRHDHFLLAAQDFQLAVFLQLADVAGVEPAVFEGARGFVRALEIARGYVLAAHQDLAIRRDLDLDAGDGSAHCALAGVERMVQRDDGCGLSQPVALDHQESELGEELLELGTAAAPRRR